LDEDEDEVSDEDNSNNSPTDDLERDSSSGDNTESNILKITSQNVEVKKTIDPDEDSGEDSSEETKNTEINQEENDDDEKERIDKDVEEMERFHEMMETLDEKRAQGELDEDEIIDLNEGLGDIDEEGKEITWADFEAEDEQGDEPEEADRMDSNEDLEDEADEQESKEPEDLSKLSSHERKQRELQKQIHELEEQLLKPRSWDLVGEVAAKNRPENSLLEKNLDVNYLGVGQMGEAEEEEVDNTIEGLIKQRIKDQSFDDVERKEEIKEKEFRPKLELSVEKSQYGLAEIYEREYLEMQRKDKKTEADDKLLAEHKEISVLFSSLCYQLDSLSNFHMTPKPHREEMAVKSQPALNMEEAIPLAVSDARTKAPEELFGSSARGAPVAKDEMTKEEKVALRLKKKKRHQKKTRANKSTTPKDDNSLAAANKIIRSSKNIESVDTSKSDGVKFTNSTAFFSNFESAAKTAQGPAAKKQKTNNSQFKL
jgi:U3 small nucleolar RNA-associated protein MPP10